MTGANIATDLAQHGDLLADNAGMAEQQTRRVGVLVLSMHRSGSSAITRMLSLLGCALPKTPMPVAFDNPQGHWESQRVSDFNDEILALAGTQWDDWLPVNARLSETLIWPQLVTRGRQILREEFAETPLFVLKDPRICKLAGFWIEVLAAEGIDPAFVLPLRNPLEVARSLVTRDGIEEHQGLLIWLRHVLAAEAATRGQPRVFTDFATLLNNWETLAARLSAGLELVWPRISALSGAEISQFLTPELRHHVSDVLEINKNEAISSWVRGAYEVLLGWAHNGENSADYPKLDAIVGAFDEAGIAFARPMFNAGVARERAAQSEVARVVLAEERDRLAGRLGEVEAEYERVSTAYRVLGAEHSALADDRDRIAQQLGEVTAEHDRVHSERDALIFERDQLAGERATLGAERDRIATRLGEVETGLAHANAESAAAFARAAVLAENLGNAQAGIDELKHHKAVAESTLQQREEEIAQLTAELEAATAEARQTQVRLTLALENAQEQARRDGEMRAHLEASVKIAEDRLDEHFGETARLSQIVFEKDAALAQAQTDLHSVREQAKDQARRAVELNTATAEALTAAERRIVEHHDEIAFLSGLARDKEAAFAIEEAKRAWLIKVVAMRAKLPGWWGLMPRQWRLRQEHRRLLRRGLFDVSAYLERYPDVAIEGIDPVHHYILHGIDENREIKASS